MTGMGGESLLERRFMLQIGSEKTENSEKNKYLIEPVGLYIAASDEWI